MWTLLFIFALMPVLIFIDLTMQRWLFKNAAAKRDVERKGGNVHSIMGTDARVGTRES